MRIEELDSNMKKLRALMAIEELRKIVLEDQPKSYDDEFEHRSAMLAQAFVVVEAYGYAVPPLHYEDLLEKMALVRVDIEDARERVAHSAIVAPF